MPSLKRMVLTLPDGVKSIIGLWDGQNTLFEWQQYPGKYLNKVGERTRYVLFELIDEGALTEKGLKVQVEDA